MSFRFGELSNSIRKRERFPKIGNAKCARQPRHAVSFFRRPVRDRGPQGRRPLHRSPGARHNGRRRMFQISKSGVSATADMGLSSICPWCRSGSSTPGCTTAFAYGLERGEVSFE